MTKKILWPGSNYNLDEDGYFGHELATYGHGTREDYQEHFLRRLVDHIKAGNNRNRLCVDYVKETDPDTKNKLREELILKFCDRCFAPNEDQLIPYDMWDDPECFNKCSILHLYHPHWRLAFDRIMNRIKRKSDTLMMMPCSGLKPYSANPVYKMWIKAAKQGLFDFMIASLYPVPIYPIDCSRLYPFVVSDWPHATGPRLNEVKCNNFINYLNEFLERFKYKKIIYLQPGDPYRQQLTDLIRANIPKDIEFVDVMNDSGLKQALKDEYPGLYESTLLPLRFHNLRTTREHVAGECEDPNLARKILKLDVEKKCENLEEIA